MWGKLKLLRPHRASCGQARAGDGATAGFHSGKSYDQSCASGREQCANKDLKQHGSDRYKEGPKWKKSRVLSPSGHSLCSQIHALTAKQNLKAKTTQPHNHSFFIFFWLHCMACGILVPQAGTEFRLLAVKVQSSNHWTS